jgi:hypothetical protein
LLLVTKFQVTKVTIIHSENVTGKRLSVIVHHREIDDVARGIIIIIYSMAWR